MSTPNFTTSCASRTNGYTHGIPKAALTTPMLPGSRLSHAYNRFKNAKIGPEVQFYPLLRDSIILNPTPASTALKMALFCICAQTGGILKSPAGPWAFEIGLHPGGLLIFELNAVGF